MTSIAIHDMFSWLYVITSTQPEISIEVDLLLMKWEDYNKTASINTLTPQWQDTVEVSSIAKAIISRHFTLKMYFYSSTINDVVLFKITVKSNPSAVLTRCWRVLLFFIWCKILFLELSYYSCNLERLGYFFHST